MDMHNKCQPLSEFALHLFRAESPHARQSTSQYSHLCLVKPEMSTSSSTATLQLNRRLQNYAFESWKIGSSFVVQRSSLSLPGSVFLGAADAVDFVHTRASLLCNHLFASRGRFFVVICGDSGSLCISEITAARTGQHVGPAVVPVAGELDHLLIFKASTGLQQCYFRYHLASCNQHPLPSFLQRSASLQTVQQDQQQKQLCTAPWPWWLPQTSTAR